MGQVEEPSLAVQHWKRARELVKKIVGPVGADDRAAEHCEKRTLVLKPQHWLEATDAHHRYGTNLEGYYNVWKASATRQTFFEWLDHGDGRFVEVEDVPRNQLMQETVAYCCEGVKSFFETEVFDGLLRYKIGKRVVHTLPGPGRGRPSIEIGPLDASGVLRAAEFNTQAAGCDGAGEGVTLGDSVTLADLAAGPVQAPESAEAGAPSQKPDKWMYVLDIWDRMYVARKVKGKLHHSSLSEGGIVKAAGSIVVDHGAITMVTAWSGHYRPKPEDFEAFVDYLRRKGAQLDSADILFYKDDKYKNSKNRQSDLS